MAVSPATRTNTKDDLRDHARRLFAAHGYEGVSMRDIAGSVGIQQSAIYNHFPSKQQLLVDLMESHMRRLLDAMHNAVGTWGSPVERLVAFTRFHVTYHIDQPEDVFLAYMELRSLETDGRAAVVPLRDAYEATLRAILADGAASGEFRISEPSVVSKALLAMMTGVTVWFRDDGRLDRDAVADTYVQTALQAVGADT
ncbi:MAG: TetR/AcrR family transcriptional regulator [Silicimonas sp.]|jgi:AcrR family transcriptional regulator|nr:TetR/AcrR family transcriptional regulator [Silicimonas sp.]